MAEFKARLVDKDGNPLGTALNPLKISGGGTGTSDHTLLTNRDVASQHPASCITADTTNFNLNLSAADDTVQKALDTLDGLIAGGGDVTITAKAKVALKKGQAVFITPGTAAQPDVDLCDNTNTAKSRVLGVVTADASSGATCSVRRYGTLTNVDTRTSNTDINPNGETWLEGDLLFATTGGGLTKVRPTSGRCVKVAYSVTGSKTTDTLVLFPMENPVWVTAASGEDVVLRLGDSSGVRKVSIRDYANTEVAYIDSDGKYYGDGSTLSGIDAAPGWTQTTAFTATPASTSTITMTSDLTGSIKVGMALKYTISSVVYYGVVTAITSNLLTVAGAPMGGDVTALYYSTNPAQVVQTDFFITGAFADAANTGLLASDMNTKFDWNLGEARLVQIRHTVKTDDSGAAQPRVNLSVGGNVVSTSNSNAGVAVAETWSSTVVDINTTNYVVARDAAIEVVTDANGTNDDAGHLTVSGVFVLI